MEIIGKAKTVDLTYSNSKGGKEVIKGDVFNIVAIGELENGVKVYITDQEHKPREPLVLVEQIIKEYTPVSK